MLLNGWNVIYRVKFDGDNQNLQDDFDTKEEAVQYAKEHLNEKPVVLGTEVFVNEFGDITDEEAPEIIYSYADEFDDEDTKLPEEHDDLEKRLSQLEQFDSDEEDELIQKHEEEQDNFDNDEAGAKLHRDFPMYDSVEEPKETEVLTEGNEIVAEIKKDPAYKDLKDATVIKLIKIFREDTGAKPREVTAADVIEWAVSPKDALFYFADQVNTLDAYDIVIHDPKLVKACVKLADKYKMRNEDTTDEECVEWLIKDGEDIESSLKELSIALDEGLTEDLAIFDPFSTDFSDISRDEAKVADAIDGSLDPVEFLNDLVKQLGIEDEVEIKPVEDKIPEVEEPEVIADTDPEIPDAVEDIPTPIKMDFDSDFFSDYYTEPEEMPAIEVPCEHCEEPKAEVVVTAEFPTDVASETPVTVEIPVEDEVKVEDDVKVDVAQEAEQAIVSEEPIATDAPKEDEPCDPYCDVEKPAEEISDCHVCPECGKEICECGNKELAEENKVLTDYVQDEMTKGKSAEEVAKTDEFKELAKEEGKKDLEEESHPTGAQPEVDLEKIGQERIKMATAYGKPVIYGYMGTDHHGNNRYYEIDPILCDDLKAETAKVMSKYHPSGSVLVAYPDKLDEAKNCEKEDKELFIEDPDMSDAEFAEALKKGLEEKHCKHCTEAVDPYETEVYLGYNTDDSDIMFVGNEPYSNTDYYAVKDGNKYILSYNYVGDDGEITDGDSEEFDSIEELEAAIKDLNLQK